MPHTTRSLLLFPSFLARCAFVRGCPNPVRQVCAGAQQRVCPVFHPTHRANLAPVPYPAGEFSARRDIGQQFVPCPHDSSHPQCDAFAGHGRWMLCWWQYSLLIYKSSDVPFIAGLISFGKLSFNIFNASFADPFPITVSSGNRTSYFPLS